MPTLPNGVRATLHVYLTNGQGDDLCLPFGNMQIVPSDTSPLDAVGLARAGGVQIVGDGWRAMTNFEIDRFNAHQENDQ